MRLNYDTFTGRRSAFVVLATVLILLSWVACNVCTPMIQQQLAPRMGKYMQIFVLTLIPYVLIAASVAVAALIAEPKRSVKEKMGFEMEPGYSLGFLFPVFVLAVLCTFGAQIGLGYLLKALGREPKAQAMVDLFRTMKPLTFAAFAAITVIAAPVAEELAFRHVFYRFVRVFLYKKESAVVVSLVFALCHVSLVTVFRTRPVPWEMLVVPVVPLFVLALFLQWQYERSKSVIPTMLMHAGFNLISVILLAFEVFCGPPPKVPAADDGAAAPAAQPAAEAPANAETPAEEAPAADGGPAPVQVGVL